MKSFTESSRCPFENESWLVLSSISQHAKIPQIEIVKPPRQAKRHQKQSGHKKHHTNREGKQPASIEKEIGGVLLHISELSKTSKKEERKKK